MSLFSFRTRSAERDDATDQRRFDRLERLLDELADEIAVEKSGLERRYASVSADAAFLDEAIENEDVSRRSKGREAELTSSILACERRLGVLSRQTSVIVELRQNLIELTKKIT
ncbi:MAG: hypothetical protein JNK47_18360 [Mesorhizobium sp.]|nr:hypothetical protein [Mesorhizobium sp.]MBL8579187.1 hypothetical protein [Mesorhizobium sp.]